MTVDLEVKRICPWLDSSLTKGFFQLFAPHHTMKLLLERLQDRDHSACALSLWKNQPETSICCKVIWFNGYQHQNHSTLERKACMCNYIPKKCSLWGAIFSKSDKQQESFLLGVWKEKWKFPGHLPPPSGSSDPPNINLQRPEGGREVLTVSGTHPSSFREGVNF